MAELAIEEFDQINCPDEETVDFDKPFVKKPDFKQFLENNLGDVINCPITSCTMYTPIIASDGFTYELTQLTKYMTINKQSPKTREQLNTSFYPCNFIKDLVEYCDENNLEVSKIKFECSDLFEDQANDIINALKNGDMSYIYNCKKFLLNFDINGKTFLETVLTYLKNNTDSELDAAKHLFEHSENILMEYPNNENILHVVFRSRTSNKIIEHVLDLVENVLKIDLNSLMVFNTNYYPYSYLFSSGNTYILEKLLSKIEFKYCKRDVSWLLQMKRTDTVNKLLDSIDFDTITNKQTMLIDILGNKINLPIESVKWLLEKGVNPNDKDQHGLTALYFALYNGFNDVALLLIDKTENLNEGFKDNWRYIHIASYYCNADVVRRLLDNFVEVTTTITKFNGENKEYLPINLVELSNIHNDETKNELIDYMVQLMSLQTGF